MSLLDDLNAAPTTRRGDLCVLGRQIVELIPRDDWNAVALTLVDPSITLRAKMLALEKFGVTVSPLTMRDKLSIGCRCDWCSERPYWKVRSNAD